MIKSAFEVPKKIGILVHNKANSEAKGRQCDIIKTANDSVLRRLPLPTSRLKRQLGFTLIILSNRGFMPNLVCFYHKDCRMSHGLQWKIPQ